MSFLSGQSMPFEALTKVLEQMEKSLCKITTEKTMGTGFFCKINFRNGSSLLPVLITTNHLLNEDSIRVGKTISFSLKNDKFFYKIVIDKNRRKYTSPKYDITMIEILPKDNLDVISFLNLDRGILDKKPNQNYLNEQVYTIQYTRVKGIYSTGNIKDILDNKYNFSHSCSAEEISIGCPILSLNNYEVIGVHIGRNDQLKCNVGTFINKPIEEFN